MMLSKSRWAGEATAGSIGLKLDRIIEPAALRAARPIHIRVIRINEAAFPAAENMVGAGGRTETLLAPLVIDANDGQSSEGDGDIADEDFVGRHVQGPAERLLVKDGGTVCHLIIAFPHVTCGFCFGSWRLIPKG